MLKRKIRILPLDFMLKILLILKFTITDQIIGMQIEINNNHRKDKKHNTISKKNKYNLCFQMIKKYRKTT
jgi:hypothetical protein